MPDLYHYFKQQSTVHPPAELVDPRSESVSMVEIGDIFGDGDSIQKKEEDENQPPIKSEIEEEKQLPEEEAVGQPEITTETGKRVVKDEEQLNPQVPDTRDNFPNEPTSSVKRVRPVTAEHTRSPVHAKRRRKTRKTVAGSPVVEEIRPPTPKLTGFARRSPRTLEKYGIRKTRRYDAMTTHLGQLELLFGSKFPALKLTFTRKLAADPELSERRKDIRNWCHEIKNPVKTLCRPSIDVSFVDPPTSIDGLTSIALLVCHPDENGAADGKAPSLDLLCTLAKGGLILSCDFVDLYSTSTPYPFPPPLPPPHGAQKEETIDLKGSETPKRNGRLSTTPSRVAQASPLSLSARFQSPHGTNPSSSVKPHLPGEHPGFPSVLERHPLLSGSRRRLMEGMAVVLAGDFAPPGPPYAALKFILNRLGVQRVLSEKDYLLADLIICAPNFNKIHLFSDSIELGTPDDELKFLLYWRRRNLDGGKLESENLTFRIPRAQLFNDYTPIRASNVTPYRAQLSEELTSTIQQSETDPARSTEISTGVIDESEELNPEATTVVVPDGTMLSSAKGKIFVKTTWLVHSLLSWQLEVPQLFVPMCLKTRRRLSLSR